MTSNQIKDKLKKAKKIDLEKLGNLALIAILATLKFSTKVPRGYALDPNSSKSSFTKNVYANNKDNGLRLENEDVKCGDKGTKAFQLFSLLRDKDRTKDLLTTHNGYLSILPTPNDAEEFNLHRLAREIGFTGSRLRHKHMRKAARGTHEIKTEGLNLFHPRIHADISQIEVPDRYSRDAKHVDHSPTIPYEEMNSILQNDGVRVEVNPLNDLVLKDQVSKKTECRVDGCTGYVDIRYTCGIQGLCSDHYEMYQYYDKDNERDWMCCVDDDEDGDGDEEGGM
eukprot:scaffold2098_cov72-Skeletonema_marinoi.AAC.2